MRRRIAAAALCLGLGAAEPRWTPAWAASPDSAGPALPEETLRQVLRVGVGGTRLRLRLSNRFGSGPLTIGPVRVARHGEGPSIRPGTDRAVSFGGAATLVLPKGAEAWSDPVALELGPLEELAVSLHLPSGAAASTIHTTALQTVWFAPGDATAAAAFPAGGTDDSRYFLTDLEVAGGPEAPVLVVLGDSVSDGVGTTPDRNLRWPDLLAARLRSDPSLGPVAVLNAGISGNRVLHDGRDPFIGPSALARFDRDVLDRPGARWVLVLEGINDIFAAEMLGSAEDRVSAAQITAGLKALADRAHARGLKILGGTLLPAEGVTGFLRFPPAAEAKRQAVNAWIRGAGAFDAVVDFDRALRDPAHPARMNPAYASPDHAHPNDAGARAMAEAVDLRLLR